MQLKEVCTADVVCCGAQSTAVQAARLMRRKHVGDVVIVDDPDDERNPIGVVTDRDLALEVLGRGLDPETTTVASLIRAPVVIAQESEDTDQLVERMRMHGVRRVPVVDHGGAVVGIITLDDLLRLLAEEATALLAIMAKGRKREQSSRR